MAWDGEGITRKDGKHVYALLANSRGNYILSPAGLSTYECLDFIATECEENKKSIHAGFVFSYDAAMIVFADMDYKTVKKIWEDTHPYGVEWKGFRIKYRNRKSLTVSKIGDPRFYQDDKGNWKANIIAGGVIWDTFGFFQLSFVKTIEKWLGKDYPDLAKIKSGKLMRGDFTAEQLEEEILPYCLAELDALVKILELLSGYLKEADLRISRWDGAGAVAAAMLKKHNIKAHMGTLPDDVEEAAQYAYFGGRIEIMKYGHYVGNVPHYDINSAYPSVQRTCPSLAHGHWETYTKQDDIHQAMMKERFTLCLVEWQLSSDRAEQKKPWSINPFPYREKGGTVIYPFVGRGWYWLPEVTEALHALPKYKEYYPGAYVKVIEAHSFIELDSTIRPFHFFNGMYATRRKWKLAGKGAEKVLKLGINSGYGKTAQSKGYNPKTGRKPPYHNLAWAGFITSATRAKLYGAAMQKPESILFIATDGIFSLEPLDLPLSEDLGEWEFATHDELTIVQSGVYFVRTGKKWEEFSRGFDKDSLNHDAILDAWSRKETVAYFSSTRFCAMGTSTTSRKAWAKRGCWVNIGDNDDDVKKGLRPPGRKLNMTTARTKRNEKKTSRGIPLWVREGLTPDKCLIDTFASFNHAGLMQSNKYKMPWDKDDGEEKIDGIAADVVLNEHYDTLA